MPQTACVIHVARPRTTACLAVIVLGLSRPGKEAGHILGHLCANHDEQTIFTRIHSFDRVLRNDDEIEEKDIDTSTTCALSVKQDAVAHYLRSGGGSAIGVLNSTINQLHAHADLATREVRVVVLCRYNDSHTYAQ